MRRFLLCCLLAGAVPAHADTAPRREGEYGGVVPGQKPDMATRPAKPRRPPARGTLSWIGFEAKDGGAQLFLQSVGPFEVSQKVVGATLVATLTLTKLASNTWRKVDTRFFDNPLSSVTAKAVRRGKSRGIEVRIDFKNPRDAHEASLRSATEADGMHYAYLTFPAGTESAPTTTPSAKTDEPE